MRLALGAFPLHALAAGGLAGQLLDLSVAAGGVALLAGLLHRGLAGGLVLLARRLPRLGARDVADDGLLDSVRQSADLSQTEKRLG